jgi:hypothetical protein
VACEGSPMMRLGGTLRGRSGNHPSPRGKPYSPSKPHRGVSSACHRCGGTGGSLSGPQFCVHSLSEPMTSQTTGAPRHPNARGQPQHLHWHVAKQNLALPGQGRSCRSPATGRSWLGPTHGMLKRATKRPRLESSECAPTPRSMALFNEIALFGSFASSSTTQSDGKVGPGRGVNVEDVGLTPKSAWRHN